MNKTRFELFSDGVFAIVITLLAIELKPFHIHALKDFEHLVPELLIFVLSFLSVGLFWINHHSVTDHIKQLNFKIVWTNLMMLMFITLIPFATALLGENLGITGAIVFYNAILLLASLSFYILRREVHKTSQHSLVLRSVVGPMCYLFAILIAFIAPPVSYLLSALPIVYYLLPSKIFRYRSN